MTSLTLRDFRALFLFGVLVLGGCATIPPPTVPAPIGDPLDAWATVLRIRVDPFGRIDFDGLAQDRALLDQFVGWLANHGPDSNPSQYRDAAAVLAYHLNAYNALAMFKVLEANIPPTLSGWRKIRFFVLDRVEIDGEVRSLYGYENQVIRPLGEPRVHVALNCMVAGCPRLPRAPFAAAGLDTQLDEAAREFFNDERHVRVDTATQIVHVSEILDFYPDDFLAVAPSLIAYINRYRREPIPETYQLAFIDYDWTLNRQP